MNHSPWQLDPARYRASLQADQFSTEIALDRPQAGWLAMQFQGQPISFAPVQVVLEPDREPSASPPATMHVRGSDLIATYPASGQRDFTAQIYRGVQQRRVGQRSVLVISTLVSLNTQLLDARPAITLRTDRPANSAVRRATEAGFADAAEADANEVSTTGFLLRTADSEHSYLELWHAIDYCRFEANDHHLIHAFAEPLEKGVIRRLLIWSAFIPPTDDLAFAGDLQQQFFQTAPPLTT